MFHCCSYFWVMVSHYSDYSQLMRLFSQRGRHAQCCSTEELLRRESRALFSCCPPLPHTHTLGSRFYKGDCFDASTVTFGFSSPLAVFTIHCYMATVARSAPLPERNTLVEDPRAQEIVQRSRSLIEKILLSIPDTHKSCIHSKVRDSTCVHCFAVI